MAGTECELLKGNHGAKSHSPIPILSAQLNSEGEDRQENRDADSNDIIGVGSIFFERIRQLRH
jgi:hypothetical protein